MKYEDRPGLAERWGRRLGARLRSAPPATRPGLVTAVPMHPARRRRRGFNQAERIARAVASELDLPFQPLLQRVRNTPPLYKLGRERRRDVLEDAFAPIAPLPRGTRVLLVDDVRTTGETLHRCAAIIGRGTGRPVDVAVLAVALEQELARAKPSFTRGLVDDAERTEQPEAFPNVAEESS